MTRDVGPCESSVQSFETKNTASLNIENRVGQEGGRKKMTSAAFSLFKCDCFTMFQEELVTLTEPPWERQE